MFPERMNLGMKRADARQLAEEGQQREGALIGTKRTGTVAKEADWAWMIDMGSDSQNLRKPG